MFCVFPIDFVLEVPADAGIPAPFFMVGARAALFDVGIELTVLRQVRRQAEAVFEPIVAIVGIEMQLTFIISKMQLTAAAEFVEPVGLGEELGLLTFIADAQPGPADRAFDVVFVVMHAVCQSQVRAIEPAECHLCLRLDKPALLIWRERMLPAVFHTKSVTVIVEILAMTVCPVKLALQMRSPQGKVKVLSVTLDARIVKAETPARHIAVTAEIAALALRVGKSDSPAE